MDIVRRIGPHPHSEGTNTGSGLGCPDIFELDNGDFAIIGRDLTPELISKLPADAGCGSDEKIVVVDRHVLVRARLDIPTK